MPFAPLQNKEIMILVVIVRMRRVALEEGVMKER